MIHSPDLFFIVLLMMVLIFLVFYFYSKKLHIENKKIFVHLIKGMYNED